MGSGACHVMASVSCMLSLQPLRLPTRVQCYVAAAVDRMARSSCSAARQSMREA
jgi:hypothetical protein